ncbi:MAG: hypothetical protein K9G80_03955 [Candidatus Nanopelagicales bacterium]|nr:hypothetical protein [Candidatus Nanopelagicales bacterium]MCF8556819.1 hypothetical protein [Candidatus Nanopelagicales bacterium]
MTDFLCDGFGYDKYDDLTSDHYRAHVRISQHDGSPRTVVYLLRSQHRRRRLSTIHLEGNTRMRKSLLVGAVAAVCMPLSLLAAAPPAAATQTYNFTDCGPALNGQTISSPSGDDVRLTFTTCLTGNPLYLDNVTPVVGTSTSIINSGTTITVSPFSGNHVIDLYTNSSPPGPPADGFYRVYYKYNSYQGVFYVSIAGSSPTPSGESSLSSGPAPVLQQFGKPATGTCDEGQPEGLDWAGVPSGGWSTAWGEWMNNGLGGWACSRTLSYSTAQSKWVVD